MTAVEQLEKMKTSVLNKRKYQKIKDRLAERYQNDAEWREKKIAYAREYYKNKKSKKNR